MRQARPRAVCSRPHRFLNSVTVKFVLLVTVTPLVVTPILPVFALVGTVAVICVAEFTVKVVAATPPNVTLVVPETAVPVIVTEVGMIGGREQEALAEVNRAHELDPRSPVISRVVASVHVSARQYDEAIAICRKVANENPAFAVAHDCLGYAYWGKRMYPASH